MKGLITVSLLTAGMWMLQGCVYKPANCGTPTMKCQAGKCGTAVKPMTEGTKCGTGKCGTAK